MSHERGEAYTEFIYSTEDAILNYIKRVESKNAPPPNFLDLKTKFLKRGWIKRLPEEVFNAAFQRAVREERVRFVSSGKPPIDGLGSNEEWLLLYIRGSESQGERPLSLGDIEFRMRRAGFNDPVEIAYKLIGSGAVGIIASRGKRDT